MLLGIRWRSVGAVAVLLIAGSFASVASQSPVGTSGWQTLTGSQPQVIARGGFSGLFPDSSYYAYVFANVTSLSGMISWCDLQLTKDGVGVCLPDVNLGTCTNIPYASHANENRTYSINGHNINGWFTVDYTYQELWDSVQLVQGIPSRTEMFDSMFPIYTVEEVQQLVERLWLNVEHDMFYKGHNLSMVDYVLMLSRDVNLSIAYISSPEIAFLKSIGPELQGGNSSTKLIFRIPKVETIEPSTNQTYDSLLSNLEDISTFASGILVPKNYIWPVTDDRFLLPHTSIVSDAHNASLEVFAYHFMNDGFKDELLFPFNHSYDPVREYLSFIGNDINFSVDGLVSDFPVTASEAIGCFSHLDPNNTGTGTPLIISHNGDSGDFPGCTDLAYESAVDGGADVIDCSVQLTKDRVLICMSSINLVDSTTVDKSPLSTRRSELPEIQSEPGIFTLNVTWEEIKSLKPAISTPFIKDYNLQRNPSNRNAGSFLSLQDFLEFAKDKSIKGVLINVENARFLVGKLGFNVVGSIIAAVSAAGYDEQTSLEVMVQSSSSATLILFREQTKYKTVYMLDEFYGNADNSSLIEIKNFADAVAVDKKSIFPTNQAFITSKTGLVQKLKSANLSVYAYVLRNEFVDIPWDFFSDPYVQIHNLFEEASVDGVITDFPATAQLYRRKTCQRSNFSIPLFQPGLLLGILKEIDPKLMPPAKAPYPTLTSANISEPPLNWESGDAPSPSHPNAQLRPVPSVLLCLAAFLISLLMLIP